MPPSVSPDLDSLVSQKYKSPEGTVAVEALSQGEKDVLEKVRQALGWPSIKSLALKYFPAYRNRKWWAEALRRTITYAEKWKRRRIINIRYIMKVLASMAEQKALEAAYSAANRLSPLRSILDIPVTNREGTNRLSRRERAKLHGSARYLGGKYGHIVQTGAVEAVF